MHEEFTEEDIADTSDAISSVEEREHATEFYHAALRTNIEIIDGLTRVKKALLRFDKASADLIDTTNRRTKWMLALTTVAVILAGASVYLGWLAFND